MTEKYFKYSVDGRDYDVPESRVQEFEKVYPSSTIKVSVDDRKYDVPPSRMEEFLKVYPDASYSFDKEGEKKPKKDSLNNILTSVNDSLMRAQLGANKTFADQQIENMNAPAPEIDRDMADLVIESHRGNKTRVDEYLAEQDKTGYDYDPTKMGGSIPMPAMGLAHNMYLQSKKAQKTKGQDYTDALVAQRLQGKVEDKVEQYLDPSKTFVTGAAEGFKDTAFDLDTWDSGMAAEDAARVYAISKKLDKGGKLTEGEDMIIEALVDDLASDIYLAAGFGRGYKAGQVTGESLPFMVETMLNPASKFGESITKKFGKEIFKRVGRKLGVKAARAAVHGTRVLSDVAGAAMMSATTSQARVAEDALNRLRGQVDFEINEDGTLRFKGFVGGEDSAFKAYAKAYGANTIEHFSEMVGNYFAPIGEMAKKGTAALANKIGLKKVGELLTEMTPNGFGALVNDFAEQTQWHGMIGEFAEEMVSGAMNALVVGDQTLKKYDKDGNLNENYLFDKENMIDTFLGVAILGGVMSTAKTLGYTTPETKYNREISRARKALEGQLTEDEIKQLEAFAANPMGAEYANLTPFFDKNRKQETKEAVAKYMAAVMEKQGYLLSREADLSGTQQGMNEMQNAWQLGSSMSETDLYDVDEAEAQAKQALLETGMFDVAEGATESFLPQDVLGFSSYDLFRLSERKDWDFTEDQRQALKNLAIVKNAKEGLNNRLNSIVNAAIARESTIANESASNGVLTIGRHNNKTVFVRGNVAVSNGSIEKPADVNGYPVEIVDFQTGETSLVDSSELSSVGTISAEIWNTNRGQVISDSYNARWEQWRNTKSAKSKLAEIQNFVGEKVYIKTANNDMAEVEVQQILPNGEVLIKGKKGDLGGQSTIRVDVDSFYDSMSRDANGNPIFNQSEFRSQTQGIADAQNRMYVQGEKARDARKPNQQAQAPTTEQPTEQEAPQAETPQEQTPETDIPQTPVEPADFRDFTDTIILNGKPIKVDEVTAQDDVSDSITYRYTDENGVQRTGNTTIGAFAEAVNRGRQQTETPAPAPEPAPSPTAEGETTVPPTEQATETPAPTPAPAEQTEQAPVDWETMLDFEPENYLAEMQNRYGDKTVRMLNAVLSATQRQLDKLNKATPDAYEEILQNEVKKDILQARIDKLSEMVARLTAPSTPEAPAEAAPEDETPEVPAGEVPEPATEVPSEPAPVPVEPEPAPETPSTPEGEAPAAPVGETPATPEPSPAPIAPNPVANPTDLAQEEEKKLLEILRRVDLSRNEKQDWAYKYGKKIADMFATKDDYEEYETYLGANLGAYYSDFERGVEESFANRSKNESGSQINSVPSGAETNGETNGEQQPTSNEPTTEGRGSDTTGGGTNDGGNQEGGEGTQKTKSPRRSKGKKSGEQVEDKYPARKGNATQKLLVDTFGFESVTIPNARKEILNTIYDFMMEMSKTLGISPKSIGQGGWLSIGNLRSNKNAIAAHQIKSNPLTRDISEVSLRFKYARLSSIAHEWWHSLDRALGYFNTGKLEAPTSEVGETSFTGRKETWEAVKGVMDAISNSGYTARIEQLVKRQTRAVREYFLSNTEQAARAFDEYITMRFAEAGITIDNYDNHRDVTQPTAEEMKVVTPAIENLFKVLQEKEGKKPGTSVLYHISEEMEPQSDAKKFATEGILTALDDGNREVVIMDDEQTKQYLKAIGADTDTQFSMDTDKPIFLSNAAIAVMGIKQEKATPEQWLKMIEKAGGLKAGEDKWMGLSDWLKAQDAKTLTKQEVLDFINKNTIRIEEVNYRHWDDLDYIDEATKILEAEMKEIGWDAMVEKYPNFDYLFEEYDGELLWSETRASVAEYEQFIFDDNNILDRPINETRERYTSDGILNKKEIAIIVPTIESWNNSDVIHFGDAGDGRAVAWVRFGDSEFVEDTDESKEAADALRELAKDAKEKYGDKRSAWPDDVRAAYDLLLEQEISSMKIRKILFIDEIQSKRHQDAREQGGYRVSNVDSWLADNGVEVKESGEFYEFYKNGELDRRFSKGLLRYDIGSAKNLYVSGYVKSSIPEAPFERNWSELAMKRMLRYASENGYDGVAWTKGIQQANRYNIGNVVNSIVTADHNGNKRVRLYLRNAQSQMFDVNPETGNIVNVEMGNVVSEGMQLSDIVGKELAVSILNNEGAIDERGYRHIEGEGLRIGGEGMKGFYDKMLPAFLNKYGNKWGVKVSDIELPLVESDSGYTFHSVPVNDAMRESVMEGQPMFYKTPNGTVYGWTDGKKIYLTKAGLNPNTPIHEYTHLWAKSMMQKNPKGWNSIKQLLKGTPVWNEVMNDANYSNIHSDEDLVASEALSRISGSENAAKMEKMAQQMIDEAKGTGRKLEARGLIQNMKDALNKFWNWVGVELFGIEKFESVEQITDRVLWDLMNKTDLGNLESSKIEMRFVGENAAAKIDEATKSTWMQDNLSQAKRMKEAGYDAKTIKHSTGWETGADGKWRYEEADNISINETKSKEIYEAFLHNREIEMGIRPRSEGYKMDVFRLADVIDAPELFRAYPELKDIRIRPRMLGGANGVYRGNVIDIHGALFKPVYKSELEDVLLHELQHAIQVAEGFAEGTDASNGYDNYIKSAGEVEARNVVARKRMSSAERKLRTSEETEDTPRELQIGIGESSGIAEARKKSYGKENPYGQHAKYTPAFLDDIYYRVLSKYHFGKDSSPYVYMDGYIMRIDVPDSEHLKYYRNVEKTDGFGVRFDIFVGNITEEEFNALIEDYERGIPRTKEALSELFEAYRKNRGSELSSDNVHIENIESDTSDGRLYGQASERKDERRTSVSRSNSYLRASEIDSDISPISRVNLLPNARISSELDAEYFAAVESGDMETAQRLVDEAAEAAGYTIRGEHGRVSKFTIFDRDKANPEGNWGQGFYFSNNEEDVEENYATVDGPDLEAKIEREVEKRVGIAEMNEEFNEDGEVDEFAIRDEVEKEFITSEPNIVHAAIKMDKPFVVGHGMVVSDEAGNTSYDMQETYLDVEYEYDEDGEIDYYSEPTGTLIDLIDALNEEISNYDWANFNANEILQDAYDGMTASQFEIAARELLNSHIDEFVNDRGDTMTSEILRAAIERAGFDGIIDNTVNQKFGTQRRYGQSMAGMDSDTRHYISFDSSNIKDTDPVTYDDAGNVIPLSQRFNPENKDIRYRKSDIQNAAVDYLAGPQRNEVIERAVNEEAAKLNVSVTYATREQMPKGHKGDKGYFNTETGEVVICTENAASIADAIQTILHEAVAHKGLRQLMGDKFNEFINRVYDALDAETKAKVDALAESKYDGNTAVAMEEYMASLAETENFAENSVWDKIKSAFENIINAILGRNDIKIGDNELSYILRASYNNMVNPRNMESIRGWAQDQMMREDYKINHVAPELLSRTGIDPTEVATQTASLVYDKVVSDSFQEFQRQFQDAMQPVRIAIDAIQQETGNVPIEDYENYILIQNQSSSRSRVEIDDFARRYYSPIIEQVNKIIDTILESRGYDKNDRVKRSEVYKEVKTYLIAKHGLERNAYYQTRNTRKITAKTKAERIKSVREDHKDIVDQIKNDPTLSPSEKANLIRQEKKRRDTLINQIRSTDYELDVRDYSGLTALFGFRPEQYLDAEAEAERCVENFENAIATDELWAKIKSATDKTLRHSYESGLLSRQQYNDIKAMFQFYIPLRGFDESTAEDVYAYARFEGNRFNPAVQKAEGRTSLADDPIAIIMNMAESEIAQGNKNRAKQALYNYLLNRSDGLEKQNSLMQIESVWAIKTVDAFGNEVYVIASPDHAAGETLEEFEERMQVMAEAGLAKKSQKGHVDVGMRFQKPSNKDAHYVYLKVNGVEKAIYINGNPKAADAINGTYAPMPSKTMQAVKDVQRLVSSTFTNYSLEFTARNYFRDMVYSHINIGVRESDPAYRKKFRQNWRHNNMRAMLKMLTAYRAGEYDGRPLTEDEAAFVEFMNNGGQTGYTLINSVETHKKELERAIERMQKGIVKGGVKDTTIFRYTLGGVELLNEASELVTRFAAFKTSRDMGRGINRSINDAKEVTVNFNTKGAQDGTGWMGVVARYLGAVKYFFNASVQGVQNLGAAFQKNKLKFGSVVGGTIGLGMMMPILQGALSELMGGDEDEYWNIPEYDRQNNLCFVIGKGKYVKLPLPIGFREMYGLGDLMMAGMLDKKFARSPLSVGMDVANKIATIVLPINPLEGSANGLSLIESGQDMLLPDFTQGMVQNRTNTDFKGVPIQKEYTYNENDPQWTKAFANNPAWLTGLSKWCYENIEIDGEGWDWSPEKLDNTLSNAFGGIYSLLKKTGRTVSAIWNEDNRTLSNVPLVGVIVGSNIDDDQRFVNSTYWEMDEYYNKRLYKIKSTAKDFGLTLDDVFARNPEGERAGEHHPAMNKIYNKDYFDFMQEWYLGHKGEGETDENGNEILGLSQIKNKIKNLENKIKKNEDGKATPEQDEELVELNNLYEATRRDFVNDLLELD